MDSFLTFKLGKELYAISVKFVINILEMCSITEVPKMPSYMKGVINLRGEVLPVIDSKLKFGMPPIVVTSNTCILVLEVEIEDVKTKLGILVDSVNEVIEIKDEAIKPSPSIGEKYQNKFIIGMFERADKFIMLLDMNKVFSIDEIIDLSESQNFEIE